MTRSSVFLAASLVVGLALGCTAILDFPEEVTGYRWCLDAEPAKGRRLDNTALIDIKHSPSNNWTRACKCFCAADHQLMLQGAAGELPPGSEDALWYELQVGQLRASAATECDDRTAELEAEEATIITFDDPDAVSCLDAVADEASYFAEECTQDDDNCPPGAPGGFATDGYLPGESSTASSDGSGTGIDDSGGDTSVDGDTIDGSQTGDTTSEGLGPTGMDDWSTMIDCPTDDHCNIDAALMEALWADPSALMDDRVRVTAGTSKRGRRGAQVLELAPGSLPAALGLRAGDVITRVGELELRTRSEVLRAIEALRRADAFVVEIDRGEQRVVRSYRVGAPMGAQ